MDINADRPVLSANNFLTDDSLVLTTPANQKLSNRKLIYASAEESGASGADRSAQQIISKGNHKDDGKKMMMSETFQEDTQSQKSNDPEIIFDSYETAIAANPELHGKNAAMSNRFDDGKWQNVSFGNLLELAHAAAGQTGYSATASSLNAIVVSQSEGSHLHKLSAVTTTCDQVSRYGASISGRMSFDLNSVPGTTSDVAARESIQSRFAPITPDQATRAYKEHALIAPNESVSETGDVQKIRLRDVELNELLLNNEQSQLLVDPPCVGIPTELQEDHAPDKGSSQGSDLIKTPQQKPRRKKHRPKVVIEGQTRRTPAPRTPKPDTPEGTVAKRKYVRRNGIDSSSTATPSQNGSDKTASSIPPPGSEKSVGKRKYIRWKGVNSPVAKPLDNGLGKNDDRIGRRTRASCRRSLNFELENQESNNTPGPSPNFDCDTHAQNCSPQDPLNSNSLLQHAMEARTVRIASDLTCSGHQESEDLSVSGGQAPGPSTPKKNHLQLKSTSGYRTECTSGKCQIVFSDATLDKEVNVVQLMIGSDAQCLGTSPSNSNSSSSVCLTQETEARCPKRQHFHASEAEICSSNVSGIHYNSLQSFFSSFYPNKLNSNEVPRMHFPAIHKKRRTEKVYKSATSRAESTVTITENSLTFKASPSNGSQDKQFTSENNFGISTAQCNSGGDPTRYAIVHYASLGEKQNFNCLLALTDYRGVKKKRTKGPTRARSSLNGTCEELLSSRSKPGTVYELTDQPNSFTEDMVAQINAPVTTKKRSKGNRIASSSLSCLYNQNQSFNIGSPLAIAWKTMSPIDEMIERFSLLNIDSQSSPLSHQEQNEVIPHQMRYLDQKALVVYKRDGTIVPFGDSFGSARKRKPRPKVELDEETSRVWKLLLENIDSEGIDGTDEEKARWWEEERRVFRGRADSFIARMHLVQGDRRFSPWKGSVVDSVVGVFLTQNVSDHLSSSAFMSLAAQYPVKSNINPGESHEEQSITTKEPEFHVLEPDAAITLQEKPNQPTWAQGSMLQKHKEHNREKEPGNSSEELRSSSCGTKSVCSAIVHLTDSSENNLNFHSDPAVDVSATEFDDILSSQNSEGSSVAQNEKSEYRSLGTSEGETTESERKPFSGSTSFVELLHMAGTTKMRDVCNQRGRNESVSVNGSSQSECDVCISENKDWCCYTEVFPSHDTLNINSSFHVIPSPGVQEGSGSSDKPLCATENSGSSAEISNQTTAGRTGIAQVEEVLKSSEDENSCDYHHIEVNLSTTEDPESNVESLFKLQDHSKNQSLKSPSISLSTSEVRERNVVAKDPLDPNDKSAQSRLNDKADSENASTSKVKGRKPGKQNQKAVDWDILRAEAENNAGIRERTAETMDSLDWEAIRCADVKEIAETIKARGMNNMLAERIKDFLNRLVREHGSTDLEWLRDVLPDKAKEYLLSIRGLGLKSVECVRLLTLHHLAFPVDTNVGRIAVRLGWVPLQPLPESLQLHLLELYPVLESIQKYLWPRLCKLDQRTLYELHYQMITFGKVFCTKSKPNCNACPMRGECRHFASAFASARLSLPAPQEKSIVGAAEHQVADQISVGICSSPILCLPQANEHNSIECSSSKLCLPHATGQLRDNEQISDENFSLPKLYLSQADEQLGTNSESSSSNPIVQVPETPEPTVEEPPSPEPQHAQLMESDIEDFEDPDEIPTIRLNMDEFAQNLQAFVGKNMELQQHEMSRALVALTAEAASIPTPKLKNINRLRTEHHVYELPDSHPLLQGMDKREPDDPSPYLLAIWTPGETANSVQPPERRCMSQESGRLCDDETCFSCNSIREVNSQTVRGTLLIPCRTAMRGSFPLNGTYFQVNEVFADHESSLHPVNVPRDWVWNLPRRTVYFGTSVTTIFRGLTTEEIQYCFWRGFVCVRGFEQRSRSPKPLLARFHFPASRMAKGKGKVDEE